MVGLATQIMAIPAREVFGRLYFSDLWQQVFAIDNSFIFWGIGLAAALWSRSAAGLAFALAGLLHLATDLPLHGEDARMQFWPLTDWKFDSPFSYWDSARGAAAIGLVELAIAVSGTAWVVLRHRGWLLRGTMLALLSAQLLSSMVWRLVF